MNTHPQNSTSSQGQAALTAITYHYVRDMESTRFPAMKALDLQDFDGQLDYIAANHNVCTVQSVTAWLMGREELPPSACVLTFDDGLIDHFTFVLPRLIERGFTGVFYPSSGPLVTGKVLDVHKIQFVLSSGTELRTVKNRVLELCEDYRVEFNIPSAQDLWGRHGKEAKFDSPERRFVKTLLQKELPAPVRSEITDRLFSEYVSADEAGFSAELYMDRPQLKMMVEMGMEIGGHGENHFWLDRLTVAEQAKEIAASRRMVEELSGRAPRDWSFTYPHGGYNDDTQALLQEAGCGLAFSIQTGTVALGDPQLKLNRLDTNDLPKSS